MRVSQDTSVWFLEVYDVFREKRKSEEFSIVQVFFCAKFSKSNLDGQKESLMEKNKNR